MLLLKGRKLVVRGEGDVLGLKAHTVLFIEQDAFSLLCLHECFALGVETANR